MSKMNFDQRTELNCYAEIFQKIWKNNSVNALIYRV